MEIKDFSRVQLNKVVVDRRFSVTISTTQSTDHSQSYDDAVGSRA